MTGHEFGAPAEPALAEPGRRKIKAGRGREHAINCALIVGRRRPGERQRDRTKAQIEQPIAQTRLVVVVALGLRVRNDRDLALVETEALVHAAQLGLAGLRIREEKETTTP